ncbi:hypothetical protein GOU96_05920 [Vibrio sp. R-1]|nr:hypothetical protein [Vibrio sp. R-1]
MEMVCSITQEPITRMRLHNIAYEYRYKNQGVVVVDTTQTLDMKASTTILKLSFTAMKSHESSPSSVK